MWGPRCTDQPLGGEKTGMGVGTAPLLPEGAGSQSDPNFKNRPREQKKRNRSLPRRELGFPSYLTLKMLKLFRNSSWKKHSLVKKD